MDSLLNIEPDQLNNVGGVSSNTRSEVIDDGSVRQSVETKDGSVQQQLLRALMRNACLLVLCLGSSNTWSSMPYLEGDMICVGGYVKCSEMTFGNSGLF